MTVHYGGAHVLIPFSQASESLTRTIRQLQALKREIEKMSGGTVVERIIELEKAVDDLKEAVDEGGIGEIPQGLLDRVETLEDNVDKFKETLEIDDSGTGYPELTLNAIPLLNENLSILEAEGNVLATKSYVDDIFEGIGSEEINIAFPLNQDVMISASKLGTPTLNTNVCIGGTIGVISYVQTGMTAVGKGSAAGGSSAVAVGYKAEASSTSVAIGANAKATLGNSVAIGNLIETTATNEIRIGDSYITSITLGPLTITFDTGKIIFQTADGIAEMVVH
jgi:hypothetical protein